MINQELANKTGLIRLCFCLLIGLFIFNMCLSFTIFNGYSKDDIIEFEAGKILSKHKTPSGLAVPRMASLRYNKTNARLGPSKNHPIKWVYYRKQLPVVIIAESDDWRRIRDPSGDESWMHKRVLSTQHSVLFRKDSQLYKKPDKTSKIIAKITPGVIFILRHCEVSNWCEVYNGHKLSGWTKKESLWGILN